MNSKIGKDLTINFDIGLLEAFDEAGISNVLRTDTSADTLDPEAAELSLTLLTVTILIRLSLTDGVLGIFVEF